MVATVAGSGLGLERSSAFVLGSRGQLGGASVGWLGSSVTVNAATGNLAIQNQDEILIGKGPDSVLSRSYNSLGAMNDDNGDNWRENAQRSVVLASGTVNTAGSTVKRTDWDGSDVIFTWDATRSAYVSKEGAGAYDTITFASNVFTWTDGNSRFTETYDSLNGGRITASRDVDLNSLTFTYTGSLLTRVTTASGDYTDLTWTGNNLTQLITRTSGGTILAARTRYGYDGSNRLTSVTVDLSPGDNSIADNNIVTYSYTYDGASKRVASISEAGYNGATLTTSNIVSFTYDASNRIATVSETGSDGGVRTTSYAYDTVNRRTTITDALGKATVMAYDTSNNLTSITYAPDGTGNPSQVVNFAYNGNGDVTSFTDAMGKVTTYTYDTNGNLLTSVDAAGNTISRTYGSNNELLTETRYLVPDPDGAGAGVASSPVTKRYAYDAENHLRYGVDEDGLVTEYVYNNEGLLARTIRYPGNYYDVSALAPNATLSITTLNSWVSGITDKSTIERTDTLYDFRGNVSTVTEYTAADAAGNGLTTSLYTVTTYTYDQFGLLLARSVSGRTGSEVYTYDGLGRMKTATDMAGAVTTTAINNGTRTTTVTLANGMVKTSVYTAQGELWSYTEGGSGVTNEVENYRYDKLGRLRATFTAIGYRDFTFYDDAGRMVGEVDRKGAVTEYKYDAANRLIATIHYANQMSAANNNSLYDANGNPTTVTLASVRPAANASYDRWEWLVYDNADRVVQKIETIDGAWQNPYGKVTAYSYDGTGQLTSTKEYATKLSQEVIAAYKTNPPGGANRIYNAGFNGSAGWKTGYDPNGIISSGSPFTGIWNGLPYIRSNFTASAAGQIASLSTGDNNWWPVTGGERLSVQAGVEALGAVGSLSLQIHWLDVNNNILAGQSVQIGALGGVQSYNSKISGFVTAPAGAVIARLELYMTSSAAGAGSFNMIQPMVSSATATQTTFPAFDATPPVSAQDRLVRTFYNKNGQVAGTVDAAGAVKQFAYDKAGRLIQTTAYANYATANLTTSTLSQLVASITASTADRAEILVYDGKGQVRYRLDGNLRPTEYVYDAAGAVIRTVDYGAGIAQTSNYTLSYVSGQISSLNLAANAATRTTRMVYDGAGRKTWDINAEGGVTRYEYNNIGNITKQTRFYYTYNTAGDPTDAAMTTWGVSNPNDRITRFVYDTLGRLVYEVDAEGFVTKHQYDLDDRVTADIRYAAAYTVSDANATITWLQNNVSATNAVTISYAYDANGNVIDKWDGENIQTHYSYTAFDQIWQSIEAYGTSDAAETGYLYDTSGRVLNKFTAVGTTEQTTTGYGYDAVGNLTVVNDPRNNSTTYTYDAVGNVLTKTVPLDASTNAVTTYQYDAFGNVVKKTDPRNNASYYYYDRLGRQILSIDEESYATATSYTVGDQIETTTRYYNKLVGTPVVGTVPPVTTNTNTSPRIPPETSNPSKDATTIFTYDKLDRLTKVTDAEGYYEQYTLNAFGDRTTVRNKLGGNTTNVFDKRGLLTQETLPVASYLSTGAQQGTSNIINKFSYDARGNRTQMIEAFGLAEARTTNYTYDKNDLLKTKVGDNVVATNPSDFTGPTVTPTETYVYDKRGNLIQAVDAVGAWTLSYYDDNDRKIAEINALGTLSRWTYDANGNVTSAKVYETPVTIPGSPGGTPPAGSGNYRETVFAYDKANRLLTSTVSGNTVGYWTTGGYDNNSGIVTTNVYDANGNVIKQTLATGGGTNASSVYTYYDKLGRRIAQVDQENYLTSWTLDEDGNVASETRYANRYVGTPPTGGTPPSVTADATNDRTTTFAYDRNGRRTSEIRYGVQVSSGQGVNTITTTAQNVVIYYAYNGLGQVSVKTAGAITGQPTSGERTEYYYDLAGRLVTTLDPSFTDYTGASVQKRTDLAYDGLNNLTRQREGNGTSPTGEHVTTFSYGAGGRLATMVDANVQATGYYYDAAGRLTLQTYFRTTNAVNGGQWEARRMVYDALGQVVQQGFGSYNGSAWSVVGDITYIQYNAYGEVTGQGVNGVYPAQLSYDSAGRVWKSTAEDGTVKLYEYDAAGRVTLTISSNGAALPAGYSWSTITLAQALSLLTSNGTQTVGNVNIQGMVVTINVYDGRGQLVQVREPFRETTAIGSAYSTITHGKAYNAFGEVVSETDARGNVTNYSYNTMGKLVQKLLPMVEWTEENGHKFLVTDPGNTRPQEDYYYDASGRLVGIRDANNNLKTRTLLAGTGYGGEDALVLKEFHPDGGVFENKYDVFGDLRTTVNEIGISETMVYDKMHRLTELYHPYDDNGTPGTTADDRQLWDFYSYDILGQRIKHWIGQAGSTIANIASYVEKTDYDIQGRVTSQVDMGGDTTSYSYAWDATNAASGSGIAAGGWTKTTTNTAGKTATEKTDYFGHTVDKIDFGGHDYNYTFDLAGRLTARTNSLGENITYTYYNTGKAASLVSDSTVTVVYNNITLKYGSAITSNYKYDVDGNRTFESYGSQTWTPNWLNPVSNVNTVPPVVSLQSATVTWDAANRMTHLADNSAAPITIDWEYDKVGNIRRMKSLYSWVDDQGTIIPNYATQDYWYKYDNMNRFVTTKGMLKGTSGTATVTGEAARGLADAQIVGYIAGSTALNPVHSGGTDITYNAAGQRATAFSKVRRSIPGSIPIIYWVDLREDYSYTADGYLDITRVGEGTFLAPAAPSTGPIRAIYARDAMGRVTDYSEYNTYGYNGTNPGTNRVYHRWTTYNTKSQVTNDDTETTYDNGQYYHNASVYYYNAVETSAGSGEWTGTTLTSGAGVQYMGGVVTRVQTTTTGQSNSSSTTVNNYKWWDGALQSKQTIGSNTSTFNYDKSGHLQSVQIADGRTRTVSFITDTYGQVLQRDENDNTSSGDPKTLHYYFNGIEVGSVSNNSTTDVDYATSIARHTMVNSTPFQAGYATEYADFDQSYAPINGLNYQSTASRYTVQAGDTLESIAQAVWGDASFWYMLAEANGLNGSEQIAAGMSLIIPNKIHNSHNSQSTWKVYDPNEAIGDTSPTAAAPPHKKKGCGVFGQILLVAIAVAVSIVTFHAMDATLGPVLAGALSGAAGSVISQGVGVATGIQDKFSFKGVALAAIGGAVGGGLQGVNVFKGAGSFIKVANDIARGALGSALTQGIATATGLQKKFDWVGVAAAGVGAGVSGAVGRSFGEPSNGWARAGQGLVSGMAGALANAATRSLIEGSDFGDNIIRALPDVIGNTIGNLVADGIAGGSKSWRGKAPLLTPEQEAMGNAPINVQVDPVGWQDTSALGDGTTGAGDGTHAQPVAGVEGGGQVGSGGGGVLGLMGMSSLANLPSLQEMLDAVNPIGTAHAETMTANGDLSQDDPSVQAMFKDIEENFGHQNEIVVIGRRNSTQTIASSPKAIAAANYARDHALAHSIGRCYRYVKNALTASGITKHNLPGVAARNAGPALESAGYKNVLGDSRYKSPYDAPEGAIIVYDATPSAIDRNARYGHIEFRTKDGFASDYWSPKARTGPASNGLIGPTRKVSGIYILR